MAQTASTDRSHFEAWLEHMPTALQHFLEMFPEDDRKKLNYTVESLDVLESWLLRTYPSTESMLGGSESAMVGGAARYIGETLRKAAGGQWDIRLDDPKFVYFAMPILIGVAGDTTPMCPLTLTTASADRRTGNFLRTVVENQLRRARERA